MSDSLELELGITKLQVITDLAAFKKLEWCIFNRYQGVNQCPSCHRPKPGGHLGNCLINTRITELEKFLEAK